MAEQKVPPFLEAFLLLERSQDLPGDRKTLHGVFSSLTVTIRVHDNRPLGPGVEHEVPLTYFARWGNGTGEFVQRLVVERPDGNIRHYHDVAIQLLGLQHHHDLVVTEGLFLTESGQHKFSLFLEGQQVSEKVVGITLDVRRERR